MSHLAAKQELPFLNPYNGASGATVTVHYDALDKKVAFEPSSPSGCEFDEQPGDPGRGIVDGDELEMVVGEMAQQAVDHNWTVVTVAEKKPTWRTVSPFDR
ncbi:MAG: hypothetical protein KDD64_02370 [Bdellovibrionales bacterium]|nr:hypothetical protein [Bdellovibrionales bacterium]